MTYMLDGGGRVSKKEFEAELAREERERAAAAAEAKELASWLVANHPDLARKICNIINSGVESVLAYQIEQLLTPAATPEASAEAMKAKFAALDGNDPGPIPECLRREPETAA